VIQGARAQNEMPRNWPPKSTFLKKRLQKRKNWFTKEREGMEGRGAE